MKNKSIFGVFAILAIVIFTSAYILKTNKDISNIFSNEQPNFLVSPHAAIRPQQVDYGIASNNEQTSNITQQDTQQVDSKVLGKSVSIEPALFQPTVQCSNGSSIVLLSWQKTMPADSFYAQRRLRGGNWATISGKLTGDILNYSDPTAPSSTVLYRIRRTYGNNISYSNSVSVSVLSCPQVTITPPPPITATTPPPPATITPPPPSITPPPIQTVTSNVSWGAFNGWRPEDGPAFESMVGKPLNNRAVFVHWGNENQFPVELAPTLRASNTTLIIFWEAMDYNGDITNQPLFSYDAIIRGDWDTYIKTFAGQVASYGGPVIIIPFEEMNGNWNPWAGTLNNNSAAKHITAYRHIHDLFSGVSNAKFGWAVNSNSVPDTTANQISNYYPGSAYVDFVGVDGFNFASPTWMTFGQIFDKALTTLKTFNKPIYVFSMASAQGPDKAAWITDALKVQIPKHPEIVGWTWFNENKEKDWRVWSDQASLDAFKVAIQ